MDSRIINQSEIDVLFYEELTPIQLQHIFRVILILAKYMLLTTEMLSELYAREYHERMGLSYLKRAAKERLIIEYQYDLNEQTEKKVYYYALKSSTHIYLKQNQIPFIKMPPYAAYQEKSRILTYNQYLIDCGLVPNIFIPIDQGLRYFITENMIIAYFSELISRDLILQDLQKRKVNIDIKSFEVIAAPRIDPGKHTRGVSPKLID